MSDSYLERRGEIETYFDRTAAAAWSRLTSDAPVSGIRATVRAGRDRMRATLLGFLPQDLRGMRLLDVQWTTEHLASLGAVDIPRADYLDLLEQAVATPPCLGGTLSAD